MPTIECVTLETKTTVNCDSNDLNLIYLDSYNAQCGPGCCSPVE